MRKWRAGLLIERSLHPFLRQIGHACSKENLRSKINSPCFLWIQEVGLTEKIIGFGELMSRDRPNPSKGVGCVVVGCKLERFPKRFIGLGIPPLPIVSSGPRRVAPDF